METGDGVSAGVRHPHPTWVKKKKWLDDICRYLGGCCPGLEDPRTVSFTSSHIIRLGPPCQGQTGEYLPSCPWDASVHP